MYELLIANKSGKIWDVTNMCPGEVSYTTERQGQPGKLDFSVILAGGLSFEHGDVVRFSEDGQLVFYGYVFTMSTDRWGVCKVTCYDRLRYLKANASYAFYAQTAADIIKQIAEDLQLDIGELADTGYRIPSLLASDQPCIDIIQDALNKTLLNTGVLYVLYDNGTGLSLKSPADWRSEVVHGSRSYVTDYSYTTSIDANVYNSVKLVQPNESTGRNDVVVAQDSANVEKWGLLQLYQSVDGNLNTAQLAERAKETLAYYNRVRKSLPLSAIGIPGLRAGMMVRAMLDNLDGKPFAAWVLIESLTHTYQSDDHFMELEVLELTDDLT
jgi:hypothetical protein